MTGKTENGYHLLDSLVMFTENLYDELIIEESDSNEILVEGRWHDQLEGKNILQTTLERFSHLISNKKFKIKLIKNIPIGAGLGGDRVMQRK